MDLYDRLVMQAGANYSRYYDLYSQGGTPFKLSTKDPGPYKNQIKQFAEAIRWADCVVVGGASGLSAAGGGDFYYEDNASYRKYFGKYAEKYGFKGAFAGTFAQWDSREEFWGYLSTFLHTTQTAEIRAPYLDLDQILSDKEFFVITTNQDTQFVKIYPESKVAQLQGDHRYFQCSQCCTDETWDAVEPVKSMIETMGDDTAIPTGMIPRCPHCGAEMFPWVRGYGNFLQGEKYAQEYRKASRYVESIGDKKVVFLELGVGRMTPMFIQEPFWSLTLGLPNARYITLNKEYAYMPEQIEDKGLAITGDIAAILKDVRATMEKESA